MSYFSDISLRMLETSGTLGALDAVLELSFHDHAQGTVVFEISGTWKGKIVIEGAVDGTYNNLSIVQPGGAIAFTGINNDNQNGIYRALIIAGYTSLRLRMSAYTSGTATAVCNSAPLVPTAYVWQLVPENLNGRMQVLGSDGTTTAMVEARKQTPTGDALNVQIGPGDTVSNVPVMIDFDHHQTHEGEYFLAQDIQASLGSGTVKYGLTVPVYADTIQAPHLILHCDIYNGNATISLYEGATFTGGSAVTPRNKNRNILTAPGMTIATGVTSTNGTLIKTFYAGAGKAESGTSRSESEMVLKSNTIYRVDLIGRAVGVEAIMGFLWYEDLGV